VKKALVVATLLGVMLLVSGLNQGESGTTADGKSATPTPAVVASSPAKGALRRVNRRAIAAASVPESRTTPRPPRPGGVATATIVSAVEKEAPTAVPVATTVRK
jgi:hypothetical protein